jgi:hypothetical protein
MSSEESTKLAPKARVAVIVLDSGFARESLARVKNLLGYLDINSGISAVGQPMVEGQARELVLAMAQDPLHHGSIILERLLELDPDLPLVLVRGFAPEGGLIRTRFEQGQIASDGWTEGYLWAQNICAQRGYLSVANFSFGGFHHAADGSGWESFQLAKVVGPGKPGHLLAAAAGPGDWRAIHASLCLDGGSAEVVHGHQEGASTYNLWVNRFFPATPVQTLAGENCPETEQLGAGEATRDFQIQARLNGQLVITFRGQDLVPNLWNDKQQLTFDLPGAGDVEIAITLAAGPSARFDLFISREEGARFSDFVDSELVSEPAVLSQVIAVGLKNASYGSCYVKGVEKPEILLSGQGPISFRTPEVTFALTRLLAQDPTLDAPSARAELHRHWYQK